MIKYIFWLYIVENCLAIVFCKNIFNWKLLYVFGSGSLDLGHILSNQSINQERDNNDMNIIYLRVNRRNDLDLLFSVMK